MSVNGGDQSVVDQNPDPRVLDIDVPELEPGRHTLSVACDDGSVVTVTADVFRQTGAKNGVSGAAATTASALAAAIVLVIGFRQAGRDPRDG